MGTTMRGGRGISLSWQAVSDVREYEVESSFEKGTATTTVSGTSSVDLIGMTPDAEYGFRVRALKPHGSGHLYSGWSGKQSYSAPTPSHWQGHQEDHTVGYTLGSISSTTPPGFPAGVKNPANVIEPAIAPAAGAWTTKASKIQGKNLKICRADLCGGDNHDGGP